MSCASGASRSRPAVTAFAGFASFGSFWGVWGGSVPRIQEQAAVSDGGLGLALLFVGAAALPTMPLAGRALDRWGLRVAGPLVGALGTVGAVLALTATDLPSLCAGLALVGASSGAADVAVNAVAGWAEKSRGRPVITRAHGVFSTLVVLTSLAAGLASAAALPAVVPFAAVAGGGLAAGGYMFKALPAAAPAGEGDVPSPTTRHTAPAAAAAKGLLVFVGLLGALAFAGENAHQSWSAVFASDVLGAGPGLAALAPAVFAGTVAVTRFATGGLGAARAGTVLVTGALACAAGTAVVAAAPTLAVALLGLVTAGAGSAVLFPTLVGIVSRGVEETHRGRATALVTSVAYLGFLLGPVYVGLWAEHAGLRAAMTAVTALSVALTLLVPFLLRRLRLPHPQRALTPAASEAGTG